MGVRPVPQLAGVAAYPLADLAVGITSLAQNESACPPSPAALQAAQAALADPTRYPDPGCSDLCAAIAGVHGLPPGQILCGAGSMDLIAAVARAYLGRGDRALMPAHGYLYFATAARLAGAAVDMAAEAALTVDVAALLDHVTPDTRVVFVANPGNPTGTRIGRTGQAVAVRVRAMGMSVIGVRHTPGPMPDVDALHSPADLPALWLLADLVVVCTPLTPATRGLIGARAIAAMKPDAVIVDVSRGGVIDGSALASALAAGHLAGAALDVFEPEPLPPDDPLWTTPRTLISPHCSSVYDGWEQAAIAMFCDNLRRHLRGEPLVNVVRPTRGY